LSELKKLEVKIGLELHCQLTILKTKLFCGCSANYRRKEPNTLVCPICLGIPGSLPKTNEKAIKSAVMVALALNSKISDRMFFFRKNYFYPDMSKNFQISQYDRAGGVPLGLGGYVTISVNHGSKKIRIRRLHLEEDPARLVHLGPIDTSPYTLVDYNRSGIALLEIVTEPDLTSPKEARIFLQKIRSILEHLGVSDGSLEGAMRCDANISIMGGPRVEVKNISSFKEVERALSFEIIRQKDLMARKIHVKQETRHWDEARRITISLRTKEEEHDYRYFPEPDLVPVVIDRNAIKETESRMPELPDARRDRFIRDYKLPKYDAELLTSDKSLADFFENCLRLYPKPKDISNWLMTDFLRWVNEYNLDIANVKTKPEHLVEMLKLINSGVISGKIAKTVLREMIKTGKSPTAIVEAQGLTRISVFEELEKIADKVFNENPKAVKDALTDKRAAHFLVGQLMKATHGRADPQIANKIILSKLEEARAKK